jgi:hypothetical protein
MYIFPLQAVLTSTFPFQLAANKPFQLLTDNFVFYTLSPYGFIQHYKVSILRVTRWCSWLRHCTTSRKVAGSIPDGVIGNFH